jgi:hypothetical protein
LLNQQGDECLVASIDPGFGSAQQITQSYTTIEQALAVLNPTDAGQTMYVRGASVVFLKGRGSNLV